ncbi:MAG: DUF4326 domain-containing protein [Planctomycetota bacterium]|jgi:hypothetical protein
MMRDGMMLPTTRVVNIRTVEEWTPEHVYIGRRGNWKGRPLPQSPFANPYRLGTQGERGEVCDRFGDYLYSRPELMERARKELIGKILVCWCAPKPCHGDILAALCDGFGE